MAKAKASASYDASAIQQLKGLEAVRKRPGMYLGDVTDGSALHHLIEEVVANSVDEHLAGHCTAIEVVLEPDEYAIVTDNGRGVPIDTHKDSGLNALELVMCHLHAGGKFGNEQVSAGLHGIGVAAVNAVSSECRVRVHRDGYTWEQHYECGIPTTPVTRGRPSKKTGTEVKWHRDHNIFTRVVEYDAKRIMKRLEELAFLNAGLKITFRDERNPANYVNETYCYREGVPEFLAKLVGRKRHTIPILSFRDGGRTEIAMTWTERDEEDIRCYANTTYNADGGTHLAGFKNALTRIVTSYAKEHNMMKGLGEEGITGADVREGLIAIVSIKIPDISFSSQTKDKLVTPRAKALVEELFTDQVQHWFNENPGTAKKIAERAVISARAREAARKARDSIKRKELFDGLALPGKLADCQSRDAKECELFIVEGDSAGGSSKAARDRRYQAILPLRGKVLNVERASLDSLLENAEISTIITALGCGIEQTATFDAKKLRYHKIILMADADVDGAHIRTLLLTFFYRCMPRLIYNEHIFIAMPPLYGARFGGARNDMYFTADEDLEAYRATLTEERARALKVTRYKGLGEMNADALAVTTMDPEQRQLKVVTIEDAIRAERLFGVLMGDDVVERREFIEEHALQAQLDF